MNKEINLHYGKARIFNNLSYHLGKKEYSFAVPGDLIQLSKKYHKDFIGLNKWITENKHKTYICICHNQDLIYIEKELIKCIKKIK